MVATVDDMFALSGWQDGALKNFLEKIFPAPLTVLLSRHKQLDLPFWNQFPDLGFRIPDFPVCQGLLNAARKPLITTSANQSGQPPPARPEEIDSRISSRVDCFIDSGPCPLRVPSTVVKIDWEQKVYWVIRDGAYPVEEFRRTWEEME